MRWIKQNNTYKQRGTHQKKRRIKRLCSISVFCIVKKPRRVCGVRICVHHREGWWWWWCIGEVCGTVSRCNIPPIISPSSTIHHPTNEAPQVNTQYNLVMWSVVSVVNASMMKIHLQSLNLSQNRSRNQRQSLMRNLNQSQSPTQSLHQSPLPRQP